jgi:hypothetical protein
MPIFFCHATTGLQSKGIQSNHYFCLHYLRAGLSFFLVLWLSAPWVGLQIFAWTAMLGNNLENHSFAEAVTHTFDGQHPCCLCKMIAAGKKSEKDNTVLPQSQKLEYTAAAETIVLIPPPPSSALSLARTFAGSFFSKPLLPPPRHFFV